MADQLRERYGDAVHSLSLTYLARELMDGALGTEKITVGGKEYDASYFGGHDLNINDFTYREFWRLESAYDDFKDNAKNGNVLPYDNYPMTISEGQVFVVDYTKTDGSVLRWYYRSDGNAWNGREATEEFTVE
jgi:hypothetical protein